MKFQYTTTIATNAKGKLAKRPLVELELVGNGQTVNALGLIDSDTDTTMMNLEYAALLGINLEKANRKEFLGIGGLRVNCFLSTITMKVKHTEYAFTTTVAFTDSPSVDILLGEEDFFECFRIKFEKDHDTFELSPVVGKR
jgi:hypothetical protein